jgi:Uma2 family endonuclease
MRIINGPDEEAEAIAQAVLELSDILPSEDGIPMESPWHRAAMNLLIDVITFLFAERDDFYVGGNMFLYYFKEDAPLPLFRGPDFFYVSGVNRRRKRDKWCVFREGKAPHVVVELMSRSTARRDRTTKKDVYEHLEVGEYVLFDPVKRTFQGWRLHQRMRYSPIVPDERGWLWSEQLGLWFGVWEGEFQGVKDAWPRFFDTEGRLVLTEAEAAMKRAETAGEELARLRARIKELEQGQHD